MREKRMFFFAFQSISQPAVHIRQYGGFLVGSYFIFKWCSSGRLLCQRHIILSWLSRWTYIQVQPYFSLKRHIMLHPDYGSSPWPMVIDHGSWPILLLVLGFTHGLFPIDNKKDGSFKLILFKLWSSKHWHTGLYTKVALKRHFQWLFDNFSLEKFKVIKYSI